MNIIGLDIDGVLNSTRSVLGKGKYLSEQQESMLEKVPYLIGYSLRTVDPVAVGMMNRLITETNSKILLTSSHRSLLWEEGEYGDAEHLSRLSSYLRILGISGDLIGVTPQLHRPRGEEVEAWEDKNHGHNVVCIDDGKDFHNYQQVVFCNPDIGFSSKNYYDASRMLGIEPCLIIT